MEPGRKADRHMAATGSGMDLTAALTNFHSARTLSAVQTRVARKLLDMQEFQGAAMVNLIEAAGQVAAKAGDWLVAAATGLGAELDVYG